MVNTYEDMLIASRTFLKPTEMGTKKDGIFAQYDLLQQKYFRKKNTALNNTYIITNIYFIDLDFMDSIPCSFSKVMNLVFLNPFFIC